MPTLMRMREAPKQLSYTPPSHHRAPPTLSRVANKTGRRIAEKLALRVQHLRVTAPHASKRSAQRVQQAGSLTQLCEPHNTPSHKNREADFTRLMRSPLARLALAALLIAHVGASSHDRKPRVSLPRPAVRDRLGSTQKPLLLASSQPAASSDAQIDEKAAVRNTILSFVATIAFGLGVVLPMKGSDGCLNFFTFLVEKSLSVDNLFVFLMIFDHQVPDQYAARAQVGLLSALVMRGFMIAGAGAMRASADAARLLGDPRGLGDQDAAAGGGGHLGQRGDAAVAYALRRHRPLRR